MTRKTAAWCGVGAPIVFGLLTLLATLLQSDFMEKLGWDVYPSGLALGPFGWLQISNFLLTGGLIIVFGAGLYREERGTGKVVASLIVLAGVGTVLLAAKTDPPRVEATTQGLIHSIGYIVFALSLLVSYLVSAIGLRGDHWLRGYKRYFLVGLALGLIGFTDMLSQPWGNFVFTMGLVAPLGVVAYAFGRSSD